MCRPLAALAVSAALVAVATAQTSSVRPKGAMLARMKRAARAAYASRDRGQDLPRVVVTLRPGLSPEIMAATNGLRPVRRFRSDAATYVLAARSVSHARLAAARLASDPSVLSATVDRRMPYRGRQSSEPLYDAAGAFPGQWYLRDEGVGANFVPGWFAGSAGFGVTVGVVDDGVEIGHPDLFDNWDDEKSYDFLNDDADPSPDDPSEGHGTAMAGLIAAPLNGEGLLGGAWGAGIAGLRGVGGALSSNIDAARYLNGMGPEFIGVKLHSYGTREPFLPDAGLAGAVATSSTSGTINVVAAGNGRDDEAYVSADAGKGALENAPLNVVVGAVTHLGQVASYSSFGPNLLICAPGDNLGEENGRGLMTTDLTGDHGYSVSGENETFAGPDYFSYGRANGTSASAALVAAAIANARGRNANLTPRLARHLLVRTARVVDGTRPTWITNGAGRRWSPDYGFGLVDASALARESVKFRGVTTVRPMVSLAEDLDLPIPDDSAVGITREIAMPPGAPIEDVALSVRVTHSYRGDLEIFLQSPSGTRVRMTSAAPGDAGTDLVWTFRTPAFWGESARGTWKLTVADVLAGDSGRLVSADLSATGGEPIAAEYVDARPTALAPVRIGPGEARNLSLTFTNTGTRSWNRADGFGATFGDETAQAFRFAGSLLPAGVTVLPGQSATFPARIVGPTEPGDYRLVLGMREGIVRFGEPVVLDVTVPVTLDALITAIDFPLEMRVGQTYRVSFTVRNMGSRPWTRSRKLDDTGFALGGYFMKPFALALDPGETVAPSASRTFVMKVRAPGVPGPTGLVLSMRSGTRRPINFGQSIVRVVEVR